MNMVFNVHANLVRISGSPGLIGHILALAHFIHRRSMERLLSETRFKRISLSYEGYISRLIERDHTPGELAEILGVSRQACSKVVKELQSMGIIERRSNPEDARSSVLSLSQGGHELVSAAVEVSREIESCLKASISADDLQQLVTELQSLCKILGVKYPLVRAPQNAWGDVVATQPLTILLPAISHTCYNQLIQMLEAKGFEGLKPAFSQVLGLIGPEGGRIQSIAALVGVSKQAIAANASQLEQLGYLTRETDPEDQRQLILKLSPTGALLMNESRESINRLTTHMCEAMGVESFQHMVTTLQVIFKESIGEFSPITAFEQKIDRLSRQLLDELGAAGSRMLAQKLLNSVGGSL